MIALRLSQVVLRMTPGAMQSYRLLVGGSDNPVTLYKTHMRILQTLALVRSQHCMRAASSSAA